MTTPEQAHIEVNIFLKNDKVNPTFSILFYKLKKKFKIRQKKTRDYCIIIQ